MQPRDLILQLEFALLQAAQLKLIDDRALGQARDHVIQVAVLAFQKSEPLLERLDILLFLVLWGFLIHGFGL